MLHSLHPHQIVNLRDVSTIGYPGNTPDVLENKGDLTDNFDIESQSFKASIPKLNLVSEFKLVSRCAIAISSMAAMIVGLRIFLFMKDQQAPEVQYPEHLESLRRNISTLATHAFSNSLSFFSQPPFSFQAMLPETHMYFCSCLACTVRQRGQAAADIAIAAFCIERRKEPRGEPVVIHDFGSGGMAQNFIAMNIAIRLGLKNAVLRVTSLNFAPSVHGLYQIGINEISDKRPTVWCNQERAPARFLPASWDGDYTACLALKSFVEILHEAAVKSDAKIALEVFGSVDTLPQVPVDIKSSVDSNSDTLREHYKLLSPVDFSLYLREFYISTFDSSLFDQCQPPAAPLPQFNHRYVHQDTIFTEWNIGAVLLSALCIVLFLKSHRSECGLRCNYVASVENMHRKRIK